MTRLTHDNVFRTIDRSGPGVASFSRRLKGLQGQAKNVGDSFLNIGRALAGLTTVGTLGITAALGGAVAVVRDFEDQMQTVRAVAGATNAEFEDLKDVASNLGRETRFTATQAAQGLEQLIRAGQSATEAVETVGDSLNLAQANAIELADAAQLTKVSLNQFRLSTDDSTRVVDVLTRTTQTSAQNVTELGKALEFAAPQAASMGLTIETTTALIGRLADIGFRGEKGGTALRNALIELQDPSSKFNAELSELNIESTDFVTVLEKLAEAGTGADAALFELGKRSGPAIRGLVNTGVAGLREYIEELNNSGGAAQAAAFIMDQDLDGAIRGVISAYESAAVQVGDGGFLEQLRLTTLDLRDTLSDFAKSPAATALGETLAKGVRALTEALARAGQATVFLVQNWEYLAGSAVLGALIRGLGGLNINFDRLARIMRTVGGTAAVVSVFRGLSSGFSAAAVGGRALFAVLSALTSPLTLITTLIGGSLVLGLLDAKAQEEQLSEQLKKSSEEAWKRYTEAVGAARDALAGVTKQAASVRLENLNGQILDLTRSQEELNAAIADFDPTSRNVGPQILADLQRQLDEVTAKLTAAQEEAGTLGERLTDIAVSSRLFGGAVAVELDKAIDKVRELPNELIGVTEPQIQAFLERVGKDLTKAFTLELGNDAGNSLFRELAESGKAIQDLDFTSLLEGKVVTQEFKDAIENIIASINRFNASAAGESDQALQAFREVIENARGSLDSFRDSYDETGAAARKFKNDQDAVAEIGRGLNQSIEAVQKKIAALRAEFEDPSQAEYTKEMGLLQTVLEGLQVQTSRIKDIQAGLALAFKESTEETGNFADTLIDIEDAIDSSGSKIRRTEREFKKFEAALRAQLNSGKLTVAQQKEYQALLDKLPLALKNTVAEIKQAAIETDGFGEAINRAKNVVNPFNDEIQETKDLLKLLQGAVIAGSLGSQEFEAIAEVLRQRLKELGQEAAFAAEQINKINPAGQRAADGLSSLFTDIGGIFDSNIGRAIQVVGQRFNSFFAETLSSAEGVLGKIGGFFNSERGQNLLDGIGSGAAVAQALGGGTGASIGGSLLGAIGNTILPGIGGAIGSVLGSVIGGIFDDKDEPRSNIIFGPPAPGTRREEGDLFGDFEGLGFILQDGRDGFKQIKGQVFQQLDGLLTAAGELLDDDEIDRLLQTLSGTQIRINPDNVADVMRDITGTIVGSLGDAARGLVQGTGATDVDDILNAIQAAKLILAELDRDVFAEFDQLSSETFISKLTDLKDTTVEFFEDLGDVENLQLAGQALADWNASVLNALQILENSNNSIDANIDDALRSNTIAGFLGDDAKELDFIAEEINALIASIPTLTNPQEIANVIAQITQLSGQARGLAGSVFADDPEGFLAFLEQERAALEVAREAAKQRNEEIRAEIEALNAQVQQAASDQVAAAESMAQSASIIEDNMGQFAIGARDIFAGGQYIGSVVQNGIPVYFDSANFTNTRTV